MKKLYLRTDHIGPHQMVLHEGEEPPLFDPARWELLVEGDDDVIGQVSQALERELQNGRSEGEKAG
jgi:hypothetical protein